MTLQDLSLSDLNTLRSQYFSQATMCKYYKDTEREAEANRRRDLVTAEILRREDILFFQS
jgi:hypothetical protein